MQLNEVQIITIFRYYFQLSSQFATLYVVLSSSAVFNDSQTHLCLSFFGYRAPQNPRPVPPVPLANRPAGPPLLMLVEAHLARGAACKAFGYKNKTKTRKFLSV